MTKHEPPRWKTGAEVPPEVLGALRALGKEGEGAARLERVAGKLGALLDAAPPSTTVGSPVLRRARRKILGLRWAVAVLTLGTAAVWLARSTPGAAPAARLTTQDPTLERPQLTAPLPPVPAPVQIAQLREPLAQSPAPPRTVARPRRATGHARPARVAHGASVTALEARASTARAATVQAPTDQTAPKAAEESPVAPAQEPPAAPARSRSEVELLFDARQAVRSQPAAALRLLDEHKARFADGQLAPEREVLAIEALRELGKTSEAEQRLRAFRADYPDSLHMRRLELNRP
ncbi:MAG: hypothetical protein JWN48_3481 [Myxococcaceae bacterium]|nr:hypothetical protein [Myxococcaceae bacterium]